MDTDNENYYNSRRHNRSQPLPGQATNPRNRKSFAFPTLERLYKQMSYFDIKTILIRLKSRKFLTQKCSICLEQILNDSPCRMLNCYHIFHAICIDNWFIAGDCSCPNCKTKFAPPLNAKSEDVNIVDYQYNLEEFLQTI